MIQVNYKDASRKNWQGEATNEHGYPGDTNLQLGCLMRMADSLEMIAKDREQMERNLQYRKERIQRLEAENATLAKKVAALRGHINRMKKLTHQQ